MARKNSDQSDEASKPEKDVFAPVVRADAKKAKASKRIRGRLGKIGAPINEDPQPKKKKEKKKRGRHRKT